MKNKIFSILILSLLFVSSITSSIVNADTIREPKEWNGWWYNGTQWEYYVNYTKLTNGWNKIWGDWYFFNTNGEVQTGWKEIDSKWYYFNARGVMKHDTTIQGYKLGSDGAWIQ